MPLQKAWPDLHFSTDQIRKDSKSIYNRLKSIDEDAAFVTELAQLFPELAVVANERCGTWYVDPKRRQPQTVYFKSTDGHTAKWDFSLRRHNLHLIDIIAKHGGCIIVDSTRRGKRIPDSLSKTVAIWCCTLNNAVHRYRKQQLKEADAKDEEIVNGDSAQGPASKVVEGTHDVNQDTWDLSFHSLPSIVSRSEHNQIEHLIPDFVSKLMSSNVDLPRLSALLTKPLRPIWFTPRSSLFVNDLPNYATMPFWPVICLSASTAVEGGTQGRLGYIYVQGSADDHEMWSMGLTSLLFWQYREELLASDASTCEKTVKRIVRDARIISKQEDDPPTAFDPPESWDIIGTTNLAIGSRRSGKPPQCWLNFDIIVNCTELEYEENRDARYAGSYLQLPIPEGKRGQHMLGSMIPRALEFVERPLGEGRRVLIHCAKGQDRSVGITLAILVKYFDDCGNFIPEGINHEAVTKELIQRRLMLISTHRTIASPSRATLKKVNAYFMSRESENE